MDTENIICGLIVIVAVVGMVLAPMLSKQIIVFAIGAILLIKLF